MKTSTWKNRFSALSAFLTLTILTAIPLASIADIANTGTSNETERWNWLSSDNQSLWLLSDQNVVSVQLPFAKDGDNCRNKMYVDADKHFKESNGWVLFSKKFGTSDRPIDLPYFSLYNRYTGQLYFFAYIDDSLLDEGYNHGMITLEVINKSGAMTPILFGQEYPNGVALSESLDGYKISENTKIEPGNWACSSYMLDGYDPVTKHNNNVVLAFTLIGVNNESVTANADFFSEKPSTSKRLWSSTSTIFDAGKKAYETYGSVKSGQLAMVNWFDERKEKYSSHAVGEAEQAGKRTVNAAKNLVNHIAPGDTSGESDNALLDALGNIIEIADENIGTYVPLVAALADFATWGDETKTPVTALTGGFSFKGEIIAKDSLGSVELAVPGSTGDGDRTHTDYANKLGIFNIRIMPSIDYSVEYSIKKCSSHELGITPPTVPVKVIIKDVFFKMTEPVKYVVNPDSGLKVKRIEASIVEFLDSDDRKGVAHNYTPMEFFSHRWHHLSPMHSIGCIERSQLRQKVVQAAGIPEQLAIKVTLSPVNKKRPEFTFVRRYPLQHNNLTSWNVATQLLEGVTYSPVNTNNAKHIPLWEKTKKRKENTTIASQVNTHKVEASDTITIKSPLALQNNATEILAGRKITIRSGGISAKRQGSYRLKLMDPAAKNYKCSNCDKVPKPTFR